MKDMKVFLNERELYNFLQLHKIYSMLNALKDNIYNMILQTILFYCCFC